MGKLLTYLVGTIAILAIVGVFIVQPLIVVGIAGIIGLHWLMNPNHSNRALVGERGLLLPFGLGVLAPILFGLMRFVTQSISEIAPVILFCFAAFAIFRLPSRPLLVAIMIFLGIPIGTVLYAFADFSNSHNLFPFEILIWWYKAIISVPLGIILGSFFVTDHPDETLGMVNRLTTNNQPDNPEVATNPKSKCPYCGAALGQDDKMCSWCGVPLH